MLLSFQLSWLLITMWVLRSRCRPSLVTICQARSLQTQQDTKHGEKPKKQSKQINHSIQEMCIVVCSICYIQTIGRQQSECPPPLAENIIGRTRQMKTMTTTYNYIIIVIIILIIINIIMDHYQIPSTRKLQQYEGQKKS